MVSDVSQNKAMKYVNVSDTTLVTERIYQLQENNNDCIITPPPPSQSPSLHTRKMMRTSSSLMKMKGLRTLHIPRRDRYYTEDYVLSNHHCDYPKCDTILPPTESSVPLSPPSTFSSPRSTITATANTTSRFLRYRMLGTIRNYNSTKHIMIDNHNDDNDDDDARSQSYDLPSSLQEHESSEQNQQERIQVSTQTLHDVQILKNCLDQLHLSSAPTTPKTSDTRTTSTPICYQMTIDDNPFMVTPPPPPPLLSSDPDPMKNTTVRDKVEDIECGSTVSSASSTISTISSDSARRFNSNPMTTSVPLFPPLEIRCHHRFTKRSKIQSYNVPSTDSPAVGFTLDTNTAPLSQISNNVAPIHNTGVTRNSRPPYIQILPDTSNNQSSMFRLNAPKHNTVRRQVPIRYLDTTLNGDQSLSPVDCKSMFKPICEKGSVEKYYDNNNNDDEDGSSSSILFQALPTTLNSTAPVGTTSVPKHETIFRRRLSTQIQPPPYTLQRPPAICHKSQRNTTDKNDARRVTTGTISSPRRQFKRSSIVSISKNTGMGKPMTIHNPSKSLPNAHQQLATLRRLSDLSASISGKSGKNATTSGNDDGNVEYSNDPLLWNIPRRRISQSTTSVFSFGFGSIVGQSSTTFVMATTSAASESTPISLQSFHTPPNLPSPLSLSLGSPETLTPQRHVEGDCHGWDEEVEHRSKSMPQKKTAPFHNEMYYYWKQTKKRLFTTTTMTTKVEKPNSSTSLQRNPSGCLA